MTQSALAQAMEATWPPARHWRLGPFRLRDGAGGGKRVSAASLEGSWTPADLADAEGAMAQPLFLLRPEVGEAERDLDTALQARGYRLVDPVVIYAGPVAGAAPPPAMATFPHWPPLQMARDLWGQGDIGPARLAVMERVQGPKAVILSRSADRPAGVAFVASHGDIAMLHALEVAAAQRRQGNGLAILRAAAAWADARGLATLALAVTAANAPARALYENLGMQVVDRYHYRQR